MIAVAVIMKLINFNKFNNTEKLMEKKNYLKPEISVVSVEAQTLLAGSNQIGGADGKGDEFGAAGMDSDDWSGGDGRNSSRSALWD